VNYAQFRDLTIKLLNSYSASGNLTPITDDSVQDAALRFPSFAQACQVEIATTAKYILKNISFEQRSSTVQTYNEYTLPSNLFKIRKVEANEKIIDWELIERFNIRVLASLTGPIKVFYNAYPTEITDNVLDDFIFDLDEEACQAIPYYVASQILIDDPVNKSVGARLFDIYQGKLGNMSNVITQGSRRVKNSMYKI
jgi:hypothetical protein